VKLVQTPIGQRLRNSPSRLAIACTIGVAAIAGDLVLIWWNPPYVNVLDGRWLIGMAALVVNLHLVRGEMASIGLIAKPIQSWRYWVWATLSVGLAVLCCIAVGLSAWVLLGRKLPIYTIPPASAAREFFHMCIVAPVLEESIYRLALCVPLAGLSKPWTAVIVSGLVFGALHVVYGNPSPENLVGGLFLAWAYLKSGTIYVPILLHSFGNFIAWAGQVAAWYWLQGAA
jgi:membrane protease YdiL (CAAX protease family)